MHIVPSLLDKLIGLADSCRGTEIRRADLYTREKQSISPAPALNLSSFQPFPSAR